MEIYGPHFAARLRVMGKRAIRGMWRLARAVLFYPAAIALMIWLIFTGQHWIWGVGVLVAVLILDPIYLIILRNMLKWRPHR